MKMKQEMLRNKITDELQQKWKNTFSPTISIYFRAGKKKTKRKSENKEDSFDDKKMIHFSVAFTLHEENKEQVVYGRGKFKRKFVLGRIFAFLLLNFLVFPLFLPLAHYRSASKAKSIERFFNASNHQSTGIILFYLFTAVFLHVRFRSCENSFQLE